MFDENGNLVNPDINYDNQNSVVDILTVEDNPLDENVLVPTLPPADPLPPSLDQVMPITSLSQAKPTMLKLEDEIKFRFAEIEKIKEQVKAKREKLQLSLMSNGDYADAHEKLQEAQKYRKEMKAMVLKNNPDLNALNEEIKSINFNLKSLQKALSEYLLEFDKVSGLGAIEMPGGQLIRIVKVAQLELFSDSKK